MSTESNNPRSRDIDEKSTAEIVRIINDEDFQAFKAVKESVLAVAKAAEICFSSIEKGGRVIYVGAGTSGRIAVQDIVELEPTYGLDSRYFVYVMAGGEGALLKSQEGSEDDTGTAISKMKEIKLTSSDAVVGISASGRTPFVLSALKFANETGSYTIGIVNNAEMKFLNASSIVRTLPAIVSVPVTVHLPLERFTVRDPRLFSPSGIIVAEIESVIPTILSSPFERIARFIISGDR